MTYVIRAISYRPPDSPALSKDQDVIFAFQVVKKDKNTNATNTWTNSRSTSARTGRRRTNAWLC